MSQETVATYGHIIARDELTEASTYSEVYQPSQPSHLLGRFPVGGRQELDMAVSKAQEAFSRWRQVPAPKRARVLQRVASLVEQRQDHLSEILARETGKVLAEASGEIREVVDTFEFFAGEGRRMYGISGQSELPDKSILTVRQPMGVCGLITAWNFPAAVPSWKLAPALIAGNSCILKPSPRAPRSAYELTRILLEAGLPPGCLNLVFGDGELGMAMAEHPDLSLVSFTGSAAVGRLIYEACGRTLKRCALELGGKNAIVALADADRELLLEGTLWGAFGTSGQRCTSASRLILQRHADNESFLGKLAQAAEGLVMGDNLLPNTQLGPLIDRDHRDRVHGFVERAQQQGARLLTGGYLGYGNYYPPTILTDVPPDSELAREEVFGPVLAVMQADTYEQALALANDSRYGLSLSIYTRDLNRAQAAARDLEAGMVYVNSPTIGAECGGAAAFGGWKHTGNGSREAGVLALETYTQYKTIYTDFSGRLQKAQMDE